MSGGLTAILLLLLMAFATRTSYVWVQSYRNWALVNQLLDRPNGRSSHQVATPRGAGVVLLVLFTLAMGCGALVDVVQGHNPGSTQIAGLLVVLLGIVGLVDDRRSLSAHLRLGLYATLCTGIVVLLWASPLNAGGPWTWAQLVSIALASVALLWWVNLYNFMDGINGISGCQALFLIASSAALEPTGTAAQMLGSGGFEPWLLATMAGGLAGFLLWNLPSGKVFLGDVGSVFLGAFTGMLVLQSALDPWIWAILVANYLGDASFTLVRRIVTGQPFMSAHRSHAYQICARTLGSHLRAVQCMTALNVLWLLPLAFAAKNNPEWQWLLLTAAYLPLIALYILVGAGQEERHD